MKFEWTRNKKVVGLGPMDGVTDSPFRQINRRFGADFVFTEMISADGLVHKSKTIFKRLNFKKGERPVVAQIFGKDPQVMGEAANILEQDFKFDAIDINAACPSKTVLKSGHGGALLEDPDLLLSILDVVRRSTSLPLSVKTRSGYKDATEIIKLAPKLEKTGINAIIVHGRTVLQKFQNSSDKNIYNRLKSKINIPLIATGDVQNQNDIADLFAQHKVDGVLVARGALGNPWIFEGLEIIKNHPEIFLAKNQSQNLKQNIGLVEFKATILEHLDLAIQFYQEEELACTLFRKHLLWYLGRLPGNKLLKTKACLIKTRNEVIKILDLCKN
jgi:tRNA-dihydrouridine synthase B